MQIKKFINAAEELKIATLRAKEQGIHGYERNEDCFNDFNDEKFKELAKDRKYTISRRADYIGFIYEYKVKIDGLEFKNITNELLFAGDETKITEEDK